MSRETSPNIEQLMQNLEFYGYGADSRPVIATAAPPAMRKLLLSHSWTDQMGELAIRAVKLQLEVYNENMKAVKTSSSGASTQGKAVTTLFDEVVKKISALLEEDADNIDAVANMMSPSVARATWSWFSIPYSVFWDIQQRFSKAEHVTKRLNPGDDDTRDIDHWILKNEDWLRQRRIQDKEADWKTGLVTLSNTVWSLSTLEGACRQITRVQVDGFTCLDARRSPFIKIQPNIDSFAKVFNRITNDQLKGIDWSNIFVAGGIVLGTLLCADTEESVHTPEQWKGSDIDIYIYGLDPIKATEKIEHLFDVFTRNLPQGENVLVVRNTKTISFLSNYPNRRFQIILKICPSPAEVLLNFDLDVCAMGYDGKEVYMLPRAARALETGYNVFTMNMVQGHYLGTRRASQEQRVFKYANKGYGIRILPNYIDALKSIDVSTLLPEDRRYEWDNERPLNKSLDIDKHVQKARDYTNNCIKAYLRWSLDGTRLARHYVSNANWTGTKAVPNTTKPVFTHALLDTISQVNSEPQVRSCLTGFELFFRHVTLWEQEQDGRIYIQDDVWASTTYNDHSYEDLPNYPWDETFSIEDFTDSLDVFNKWHTEAFDDFLWPQIDPKLRSKKNPNPDLGSFKIRRVVYGNSAKAVLDQGLCIGVFMPVDFVEFARGVLKQVADDHPNLLSEPLITKIWTPDIPAVRNSALYSVDIRPNWMFQQLDRRLDELFEVIWSFMFIQGAIEESDEYRCRRLKRQLSRRALRAKPEDEFRDFASWVCRKPGGVSGIYYGSMGQGFWEEVLGEEEE
ncbi:hypothetical protein FRC14_002038 [Serendipita sp. 396]|nr:hypothetical protein FRC14_002038 [Serendipita sp. 396]